MSQPQRMSEDSYGDFEKGGEEWYEPGLRLEIINHINKVSCKDAQIGIKLTIIKAFLCREDGFCKMRGAEEGGLSSYRQITGVRTFSWFSL